LLKPKYSSVKLIGIITEIITYFLNGTVSPPTLSDADYRAVTHYQHGIKSRGLRGLRIKLNSYIDQPANWQGL
jgi:hypothetical protein